MPRSRAFPLLAVFLSSACSDPGATQSSATDTTTTTTTTGTSGDTPTTGDACQAGEVVCQGDAALTCEPSGRFGPPGTCPAACVDGLGCVECVPGELACDGDALVQCGDDGKPGVLTVCDPMQGLACDPDAGACTGACAFDPARPPELGCEFWAVPLPAGVGYIGSYGVGVTNACDVPAAISIELAGKIIITDQVAPQSGTFFELPRAVMFLSVKESLVASDVSYRLRSDCPVGVVQISNSPGSEATSDAARLYPTDRWGTDALVATQRTLEIAPMNPAAAPTHSYLAVVPRDDATTVTVALPPGVVLEPGDGIAADPGPVVLDRGEVLLLAAELPGDLSGSVVTADRPIQVFGGHECAFVPFDVGYCDHLEEVAPPLSALGDEYIVAEFMADPLAVRPPRPLLDLDVGDHAPELRQEGLMDACLEGFRSQGEERRVSGARGHARFCNTAGVGMAPKSTSASAPASALPTSGPPATDLERGRGTSGPSACRLGPRRRTAILRM